MPRTQNYGQAGITLPIETATRTRSNLHRRAPGKRSRSMMVTRVYADEHGKSHFSEVELPLALNVPVQGVDPIHISPRIAATHIQFLTAAPALITGNWHPAPARQFAILLKGTLIVEVSNGQTQNSTQVHFCLWRILREKPQEPPRQRRGGRACVCSGSRGPDDPESYRRYNVVTAPDRRTRRSHRPLGASALSGTAPRPEYERRAAVTAPMAFSR